MSTAIAYAESHLPQFVNELKDLLRIASISTDPAFTTEVQRCADWLVDHLKEIGIPDAEVIETKSHPLVYAEYASKASAPTILIYGHYDVQPPDPLELWHSDPFEPMIKDNAIFARGACDDKGQTFLVLKAIDSLLKTTGELPCNLKILLEGEEESGSVAIGTFVKENPEKLQADIAFVCDTAMISETVPAITTSLRGIVYTELLIQGSDRDLHSGVFGGAVANPAHVLADLIAGLHDADNRITIPNFYDDVTELTESAREGLRQLPFDESKWLSEVGISAAHTEKGYTVIEAARARPTLDVHGIWGGYSGQGAKTIIPAKAGAKLSCRLVPKQDPDRVFENLRSYVETQIPKTMKYTLTLLHKGTPIHVNTKHRALAAAKEALETTFQSQAYFVQEGGSIPVVALFKQALQLDTVMMGFALESDCVHAPNENFGIDRFRKGIESVLRFLENYRLSHQGREKSDEI